MKIKVFVMKNKRTGKVEKWTVTTMTIMTSTGLANDYELLRVEEL